MPFIIKTSHHGDIGGFFFFFLAESKSCHIYFAYVNISFSLRHLSSQTPSETNSLKEVEVNEKEKKTYQLYGAGG